MRYGHVSSMKDGLQAKMVQLKCGKNLKRKKRKKKRKKDVRRVVNVHLRILNQEETDRGTATNGKTQYWRRHVHLHWHKSIMK